MLCLYRNYVLTFHSAEIGTSDREIDVIVTIELIINGTNVVFIDNLNLEVHFVIQQQSMIVHDFGDYYLIINSNKSAAAATFFLL